MAPLEHWEIFNVVSLQKDGQLAGLVDECMTGLGSHGEVCGSNLKHGTACLFSHQSIPLLGGD